MAPPVSLVRITLRSLSILCFCGLLFRFYSQPHHKEDKRLSAPAGLPAENISWRQDIVDRAQSFLKSESFRAHPLTSKIDLGEPKNFKSASESALTSKYSRWAVKSYSDPVLKIQHFTRSRIEDPKPNLLVCLMTKDALSWGSNPSSPPRTFFSFLSLLRNSSLDLSSVSLSLLTSSPTEFEIYKDLTIHEPFARVSLVLHPGYSDNEDRTDKHQKDGDLRENRHASDLQHARRAEMAKLRNYLMLTTLKSENHVLWFDADIYALSDGLLPAMLSHTADPKVGVLTVRSTFGEWDGDMEKNESRRGDYDLNSWRGPRTKPNEDEKRRMRVKDGDEINHEDEREDIGIGSWTASTDKDGKHLSDLVQNTNDDELVRLDAVGGTVLLVRADLVRQGLTFPSVYSVGLDWEDEGWDGIETEGICLIARGLGSGCFGMAGNWKSLHSVG